MLTFNRFGALPTRNFQSGSFESAADLSPEELTTTRSKKRESCVNCTIGCEHIYATKMGGVRVEYESLFALGSLCGVSDAETVLRASQRCDQLGLDTISAGGTIAFAMECVERGWVDEPWLTFGSGASSHRVVRILPIAAAARTGTNVRDQPIPRSRRNSAFEGSRPRNARTRSSASREPFGSRISRR